LSENNRLIVNTDEKLFSRRILVGVPMTGLVRSEWVMARYGQAIPANWSSVDMVQFIDQYSPLKYLVADARNIIATDCVEKDFQFLLFIDHDVILPQGFLLAVNKRIQENEIPMWSGLYFTKSVPSDPLVYRGRGNSYYKDWKMGDEVWVDGIPMGCFPPGQKVHLNCGWRNIEDVESGESVLSHTGKQQTVYKTMKRFYNGDMIRIKTAKFCVPVELTKEHPVLAVRSKKTQRNGAIRKPDSPLRPYNRYEPIWIKAGDLTEEHIVLYRINKKIVEKNEIRLSDGFKNLVFNGDKVGFPNQNKYQVNWVKNSIKIDGNLMRLIGYYLAEGEARNSQLRFSFNVNEQEYIDDVISLVKMIFGLDKVNRDERNNGVRLTFSSKILSKWFEKQFCQGSKNKIIPEWCMFLNSDLQIELLKGYLRGDGHYDLSSLRRRILCNSVSEELILQLREIFLRLGYIPSHTKEINHDKSNKDIFRFGLSLFGGHASDLLKKIEPNLEFNQKIKKENGCEAWIKDDYVWLPIRKIERYHYQGEVFNLSVKNDESYVVSGFTVHNCTLIHGSILKVLYDESEEYVLGGMKVRKIFETPSKTFYDPETRGWFNLGATEDLTLCTRIMRDNIFAKAGWKEFQRKKFPFLIDTKLFCRHISFDGVQYPARGEERQFM